MNILLMRNMIAQNFKLITTQLFGLNFQRARPPTFTLLLLNGSYDQQRLNIP